MTRLSLATALAVAAALLTSAPSGAETAGPPYTAVVLDPRDAAGTVADESAGWTVQPASSEGGLHINLLEGGTWRASLYVRPPVGTPWRVGEFPTEPWTATATNGVLRASSPYCGDPGVNGSMRIDAVDFDAAGALASMTASFTYACHGQDTQGLIRYRSETPYRAVSRRGTDFGQQPIGAPAVRTVTFGATGLPVTFGAATVTGAGYAVVRDACDGRTVEPGASCEVDVELRAPEGWTHGTLRVVADTPRGSAALRVSGRGVRRPGSPKDLVARGSADGIGVTWSPYTFTDEVPVTEFRVFRDGEHVASTKEARYLDVPLAAGETHTYTVTVVTLGGESDPAPPVTATVPEPVAAGDHRAVTLEYDGSPVEYVSPGAWSGSQVAALYASPGSVSLRGSAGQQGVTVDLKAPPGRQFAPGEYAASDAWDTPPGAMTVRVGGCVYSRAGTITVHEASAYADGRLAVFAATYRVECASGHVRGELRWDSTLGWNALGFSPASVAEPATRIGETRAPRQVTVTNHGSAPRDVGAVGVSGPAAADWTTGADACSGTTLAVGASCGLTVTYAPKASGARVAALVAGGHQLPLRAHVHSKPSAPVLSATSVVGHTKLSWTLADSGGENFVSFNVYRNDVREWYGSYNSYEHDFHPAPGERAVYTVSAVNSSGEGPRSNALTIVAPDQQLVFVEPDAAGTRHLVRASVSDRSQRMQFRSPGATEPAISPEGARVAFAAGSAGSMQVWVAHLGGSRVGVHSPRPVTSGADDRQPSWAPDGSMLAFTRTVSGRPSVWVNWLVGERTTHSLSLGDGASSPSWLPSGQDLAVVRHARTPYVEIQAMLGAYRTKVAGTDGAIQAAVSPDGTRIAFVHWSGSGLRTSIRVVPVNGGVPVTLASLGGFAQNPAWSSDGRQVYFDHAPVTAGEAVGDADVYVVGATGAGLANLTSTPWRDETHPVLHQTRPAARPSQPRLAADFDGDGRAEPAVFRQLDGTWYVRGQATVRWGQLGDVPVPGDYNGDRRADLAVYRPSNGAWYVRGVGTYTYGRPGDVPAPADYDGDRRTDIAVFRPETGMWYVRNGRSQQRGQVGDVPVPADYTGDGRADFGVYRPSTGEWIREGAHPTWWGERGDVPVPADYDGDRKADLAVYDPFLGTWFVRGKYTVRFGAAGDVPVPGDFNGDRKPELAVFRPSTGTWYVRGIATIRFGLRGDEPV